VESECANRSVFTVHSLTRPLPRWLEVMRRALGGARVP